MAISIQELDSGSMEPNIIEDTERPLTTEGVFVTRTPEELLHETDDNGSYVISQFEFSDGSRTQVLRAEPRDSKIQKGKGCDVPLVGVPPLFISLKGLLLDDMVKPAVRDGFRLLIVGHEGEAEGRRIARNPFRLGNALSTLSGNSLTRNAAHVHAVLDYYSATERFFYGDNVIGIGGSEGAMTNFSTVNQATDHKRDVMFFYTEDPCGATPMNRPKAIWERKYVPLQEAFGVAHFIGDTAVRDIPKGDFMHLWRSRKTLNLNPVSIFGELATIPSLANGGAGSEAGKMPHDTVGMVRFMLHGDLAGRKEWESDEFLGKFPNIRVDTLPGVHMDFMRWSAQQERTQVMKRLSGEINYNGPDRDLIDWKYVLGDEDELDTAA